MGLCDEVIVAADLLITRILKAVVDGLPLPGEEGRGTIKYPKTSADLDEHSEIWDGELVIWDGPHQVPSPYRFIALSPFPRDPLGAGTGKEEEEPINCKCGKIATYICLASGRVIALCDDCSFPPGF